MTDQQKRETTSPDINNLGADAETFDNVPEAAAEASQGVEALEAEAADEMTQVETLSKQLLEKEEALAKEKKEYLFLMAEFDNFRKRTLREKSELIKNAAESALKGLLPIVDDFERGLEATATASDSDAIRQGMELIYNKLVKYLSQNGVTAIESTGKPFDADLHEAIANVPVEDPELKGKVIDTLTKGYKLNDKVLRHAKVAVGQ
ncbi:MAG: nucleotide exchange factor GrpE [Pseudoflavonifractor sp.]|nr:nucleotide exchange factor GrpE [Alloprevotella sp.]MCM1117330.1 nucleotide exchange factor GrpE [Pseudoflavonifractor sp.]